MTLSTSETITFTSHGSLQVGLLQAEAGRISPQHQPEKSSKNKRSVLSAAPEQAPPAFFARASLKNGEAGIIQTFTTGSHEFAPRTIDEDFLFCQVSSAQDLIISLHFVDNAENGNAHVYSTSHTATIPLSRLAENIQISQWYQLYRYGASDEPGSSIKLQIKYMRDQDSDSFARIGQLPTHLSAATFRPPSPGEVAEEWKESRDGKCNRTFRSASDSAQNRLPIDSSKEFAPYGLHNAVQNASKKTESKFQSEPVLGPVNCSGQRGEERLTVGVVDYALLFGPTVATNQSTSPHPSLSSVANKLGGSISDEIALWDRYPACDHADLPIPTKIEYFACPEGLQVVTSALRPPPRLSSFILSGSGDADSGQHVGICLVMFVKLGQNNLPVPPPVSDGSAFGSIKAQKGSPGTDCWGGAAAGSPGEEYERYGNGNGNGTYSWTAVTWCLCSRWPFVKQLQQCLTGMYRRSVLSVLERWENNYQGQDRVQGPLKDVGMVGNGNGRRPLLLTSVCAELLAMLCFECPIPRSGIFSVTVNLTGGAAATAPMVPLPVVSADSDGDAEEAVNFALPSLEDLPVCPYSISTLFRRLGCRGALTVLGAALKESRILLLSTDLALLPAICEAIRTLLYPLRWAHVCLPVVPAAILEMVQAPVTFILGTHTDWLSLIPAESLQDVLVVDCDAGTLSTGGGDVADLSLSFPEPADQWLMCCLREAATASFPECSRDTAIQLIVFNSLLNLLRFVPNCMFEVSHGNDVLNRPLLLSECCRTVEERVFLSALTETNAFQQFAVALRLSPSLAFFRRAWTLLPPIEEEEDLEYVAAAASCFASGWLQASPSGAGTGSSFGTPLPSPKVQLVSGSQKLRHLSASSAPRRAGSNPGSAGSLEAVGSILTVRGLIARRQFKPFKGSVALTAAIPGPAAEGQREPNERLPVSLVGATQYTLARKDGRSPRSPRGAGRDGLAPDSGTPTASASVNLARLTAHYLPLLMCSRPETDKNGGPAILNSDPVLVLSLRPPLGTLVGTGLASSSSSSSLANGSGQAWPLSISTSGLLPDALHNTGAHAGTTYLSPDGLGGGHDGSPACLSSPSLATDSQAFSVSSQAKSPRINRSTGSRKLPEVAVAGGTSGAKVVTFEDLIGGLGRLRATSEKAKKLEAAAGAGVGEVRSRHRAYTSAPIAGASRGLPDMVDLGAGFEEVSSDLQDLQAAIARKVSLLRPQLSNDQKTADGSARVLLVGNKMEKRRLLLQQMVQGKSDNENDNDHSTLPERALRIDTKVGSMDADESRQAIATDDAPCLSASDVMAAPLLRFDEQAFQAATDARTEWTLSLLSAAIGVSVDTIAVKIPAPDFAQDRQGLADDISNGVSATPLSHPSPDRPPLTRHRSVRTGLGSPAKMRDRPGMTDDEESALIDFLTLALSGTMLEKRKRDDIMLRCTSALQSSSSRAQLVTVLQQHHHEQQWEERSKAASSRNGAPFLQQKKTAGQNPNHPCLFPLHASTFEALSRLQLAALEACVAEADFLVAYDLLKVSGRYFHVPRAGASTGAGKQTDSAAKSSGGNSINTVGEVEAEFLTMRICHHPVYQNLDLWRAVLKHRLEEMAAATTATAVTAAITPIGGRERAESSTFPRKIFTLVKEDEVRDAALARDREALAVAKALLRTMHELGVNQARAASFNKLVASEDLLHAAALSSPPSSAGSGSGNGSGNGSGASRKQTAMKLYMYLQRFIDTLYGTHADRPDESSQDTTAASAPCSPVRLQASPSSVPSPGSDASQDALDESFAMDMEVLVPFASISSAAAAHPALELDLTVLHRQAPSALGPSGTSQSVAHHNSRTSTSVSVVETDGNGHAHGPTTALTPKKRGYISQRLKSLFSRQKPPSSTLTGDSQATGNLGDATVDAQGSADDSAAAVAPSSKRDLGSRTVDIDSVGSLRRAGYAAIRLQEDSSAPVGRVSCALTTAGCLFTGLSNGRINVYDLATGVMTGVMITSLVHSEVATAPAGKKSRSGNGPAARSGLLHRVGSSSGSGKAGAAPMLPASAGAVQHISLFEADAHDGPSTTGQCGGLASGCSNGLIRVWGLVHAQTPWNSSSSQPPRIELVVSLELHRTSKITVLQIADAVVAPWVDSDSAADVAENDASDGAVDVGAGGLDGCRWLLMSGDSSGGLCLTYVGITRASSTEAAAPAEAAAAAAPFLVAGDDRAMPCAAPAKRMSSTTRSSAPPSSPSPSPSPPPLRVQVSSNTVSLRSHGAGDAVHVVAVRSAATGAVRFVFAGTANGFVVVLDPLTAQCLFVIAAHNGSGITGLEHLPSAVLSPQGSLSAPLGRAVTAAGHRNLVVSSGVDRRIILLEVFDVTEAGTETCVADNSSEARVEDKAGVEDDGGARAEEGAGAETRTDALVPRKLALQTLVLGYNDNRRSADGPVTCIAALSQGAAGGGALLASADAGGKVSLWDLAAARGATARWFQHGSGSGSGTELGATPVQQQAVFACALLEGHSDRVTALAWHAPPTMASEPRLVSASLDGSVRVWCVSLTQTTGRGEGGGRSCGYSHSQCEYVLCMFGPTDGGIASLYFSASSLSYSRDQGQVPAPEIHDSANHPRIAPSIDVSVGDTVELSGAPPLTQTLAQHVDHLAAPSPSPADSSHMVAVTPEGRLCVFRVPLKAPVRR